MPKYEDFKVGDVWICRDGKEAVITEVCVINTDTPEGFAPFPINSKILGNGCFNTHTVNGKVWSVVESDGDLMYRKEQGLDLTKPLRFKKGGRSFTAEELENVPEPKKTVMQEVNLHEYANGSRFFAYGYVSCAPLISKARITHTSGEGWRIEEVE